MLKFNGTFVITALIAAVPSFAAQAATVIERQEVRMSAGVCQPALPAFDVAFRKRPLAMQNEGSSSAFITCAFGGIFNAVPSVKTASVGFTNTTATPQTVNCTLVNARQGVQNAQYFPKSISVPASGSPIIHIIWTGTDNNGIAFTYPAASCSLPPGIGVQTTTQTYDQEIGA